MLAPRSTRSKSERNLFVSACSGRALARMACGLLLIGLLWRTVRYLLQFPIWGDEVMLALNFVHFDYVQLTQKLENMQVAPLLFLWGERAAFTWMGPSMLSLRFIPFLASAVSLALYWRLTGLLMGPLARCFAVGFLAVAFFPVEMGGRLKPYSCDLLMSLALMLAAARWLRTPDESRWLAWLTVLPPVAL